MATRSIFWGRQNWRRARLISLIRSVGKKQLLIGHLIARNGVLPLIRDQPIREGPRRVEIHARTLRRVHRDHAILVEHVLVALDDDGIVLLVGETDPGRAVGQDIGAHADACVERRAHTRAGFAVPAARGRLGVDARRKRQPDEEASVGGRPRAAGGQQVAPCADPDAGRSIIEGIEAVVLAGGGYLLWCGCAAGDTGGGLVLKIG